VCEGARASERGRAKGREGEEGKEGEEGGRERREGKEGEREEIFRDLHVYTYAQCVCATECIS